MAGDPGEARSPDIVGPPAAIDYALDFVAAEGPDIAIHGWAYRHGAADRNWTTYIVLKPANGHLHWFATDRSDRPDLAEARGNPALQQAGFTFSLKGRHLPDGAYTVGLHVDAEGGFASAFTGTVVKMKSSADAGTLRTIVHHFDIVHADEHEILLHGWAFVQDGFAVGATSLVFRSGISGAETVFPAQPVVRPDVADSQGIARLADSGFGLSLRSDVLQPGPYAVGIRIDDGRSTITYFTDAAIDLQPKPVRLAAAE